MVECWPHHGRVLVAPWPSVGRTKAECWPHHGRVLVAPWSSVGRTMVECWSHHGRVLAAPWPRVAPPLTAPPSSQVGVVQRDADEAQRECSELCHLINAMLQHVTRTAAASGLQQCDTPAVSPR